jgi:hypothetical protein
MDDLFPAAVLVMAPVAIKFVVGVLPDGVWPWVKALASYGVGMLFVMGCGCDVVAKATGHEATALTMAMSGLLLAAMASKVVHPASEALRTAAHNGREKA